MFIKLAKQFAGYYFSQATGSRLWQPYVYEHVVRKDEKRWPGLCNRGEPLRQKLVESLLEYPSLVPAR